MDEQVFRWMPHHEGAVPRAGQGKRISTYTVALEAWRRGLNLKFYTIFEDENRMKIRYSISSENKTHHFSLSMGDKVTEEAFNICDNKELTKQYLKKKRVPVPGGKMFDKDTSDEDILKSIETMKFPLVLKPTDGNAGKGVFANIQNIEEIENVIPYVRQELGFAEIIVEEYIPGDEFRICVIEDRVLGAINRRPASVLGDGHLTIKELIDEKNTIRKANPHLTSRLIRYDREVNSMLKQKGYNMNSVPLKEERIFLREKSNLSAGGDAIDVTEELTDNLKEIAINVGKAIPGLPHYGVDMIINKKHDTGVILEVNSRPGLGGHLFPMEGEPRDLAKEIIDYYFPETKNMERSWLYFDFDSVIQPLIKRTASSVNVTPPPLGKIHAKKFIVYGKVQVVGYRAWIRRQAHKRNLNGFVKNLEDGSVLVLVGGTDKKVVENFKNVCFKGPKKAEVLDVNEFEWKKPIKIGFEIFRKELAVPPRELYQQTERIQAEKEKVEKEKERLSYKYERITESKSWKFTSPLRNVLKLLKR